jgi:hypothetical protein
MRGVGFAAFDVRFRSQWINGREAPLRSEDVCGTYWRSNICCLGLLLDGDVRTWAPIDQVGSLFRHQHDARSLVGSHTILMIWNGRFQPSSNGFVMSTTGREPPVRNQDFRALPPMERSVLPMAAFGPSGRSRPLIGRLELVAYCRKLVARSRDPERLRMAAGSTESRCSAPIMAVSAYLQDWSTPLGMLPEGSHG